MGERKDNRSELVNIILNSTGLTNREKYNIKLPFYVFKNGNSFFTYKNTTSQGSGSGAIFDANYNTASIYMLMTSSAGLCAQNIYKSNESVDLSSYKMSTIYYDVTRSASTHSYSVGFVNVNDAGKVFANEYDNNWYSLNISSLSTNQYARLHLNACQNGGTAQIKLNVYEWYVY